MIGFGFLDAKSERGQNFTIGIDTGRIGGVDLWRVSTETYRST
jgi:hypothetical protein